MTEIYMGNNYEKENTIDSSGCMSDRCFGGSIFQNKSCEDCCPSALNGRFFVPDPSIL